MSSGISKAIITTVFANSREQNCDHKTNRIFHHKNYSVVILGVRQNDIGVRAQSKGASYFDVGNKWDDFVNRGLNWDANKHFLDVITMRRDDVLLSIPKTEIIPGSYLAKEMQYLVGEKGYKWVNQWKLIAP